MSLKYLAICIVATFPATTWLACGGMSNRESDAGAEGGIEPTNIDGGGGPADSVSGRGLAPDGPSADGLADEAFVSATDGDGALDEGPWSGGGDAANASVADAPGDEVKDANTGARSAEASDGGCSTYCSTVMAACSGENAQYKDSASCMNACQYFPPGAAGTSSGDTLACRISHAGYAMTAPNPQCWYAGPFGYGVCGRLYEGFCDIAAGHYDMQTPAGFCSPSGGFDAGVAAYGTNSDCWLRASYYTAINMQTTGQPPGRVGLDGGFNADGPAAGNTFDCRAYHLVLALQGGSNQQMECNNVGWTSPTCR